MTHLKRKLMMTLALLLTVATGAWAESKPIDLNVEYEAGDVITTNSTGDVYVWWGIYSTGGENYEWVIKISSSVTPTISKLGIVESSGSITFDNDYAVYDMNGNIAANSYSIQCQGKVTGTTLEKVYVASGSGTLTDPYVFAPGSAPAATTPVPLTWDAATPNTATLTNGMPAGNVTVSVEYFPQATMDDGAVTAATDVKATTEDALVTIDKSKLTGVAKLMYYVSTKATAPDYDTEGWTDQVPTAANYTEAGTVNVWYYAVGTDEGVGEATATYSDGDICAKALTVTLGAAPLWNAEFDLTDAPEEDKAGKWSTDIPEGGVVKGTPVKVTYTGTKKVIGVKAEKKAKAKPLANATNEDLGKVVGADGKIYANKDAAEAVATGNAVAMICYVKEGHGLALALTDEGDMDWSTAKTTCDAHTPAVTGATWKLASLSEMSLMINAAGNYVALRDGFSAVGGTNMIDEYYWLSDESSADYAKNINFGGGYDSQEFKTDAYKVRACLEW